jgi:hypothetical protein
VLPDASIAMANNVKKVLARAAEFSNLKPASGTGQTGRGNES